MAPHIANELLEQFMINAYGLSDLCNSETWTSSGELIPRKDPAKFQLYSGVASACHRYRSVALRAWFAVYIPHLGDDADADADADQLSLLHRYGMHSCVKHMFLDAQLELTESTLAPYISLRSLSYTPVPDFDFIPHIPPTLRGLELRRSSTAQHKIRLIKSVASHFPRLEHLRVANISESLELPEYDSTDDLKTVFTIVLTPLTYLRHLSLGTNLTRNPPDPYGRVSDSDSRADNENTLALNLARHLPHLQCVEFQWSDCPSAGMGEKTVFYVTNRQKLHTRDPKLSSSSANSNSEAGETAERITIKKQCLSRNDVYATTWQRCFLSGPSGVYSWTIK
ncbi:hypothetical protein FRB95_010690 [Tulasnella sp. JGI-2019a]|nr:hypothetical protein FRB95_010690 [Tulasnella sp. JGI-2019a]